MVKEINQNEKAEMDLSLMKANLWFIVVWVIWIVDVMDKTAINAVLPLLKKEFLFTDAQLGLISSIVSLAIGILALPVAMLVDRWSRRKVIAIMVSLWSLATFFTGRATGYASMLIARGTVGVGEAGYIPAAITLVSAWYPKKMRGMMMGILYSAAPLGNLAGIVVAGIVAHHYGWRTCFGILAAPGLILAILAWHLPDYKTLKGGQAGGQAVKISLWTNVLYILKSPALLFVYLTSAATVLANLGFATWGVTFFVRTFGLNVKDASVLIGMMILFALPGAIFGGWLGDKLVKRMSRGRLLACAINAILFFILITIALQAAAATQNMRLVVVIWTLASFFLFGIVSNQYAIVQDLAAPHFRATAAGFMPLSQQVLGGFPGPIIVGAISDRLGLGTGLQVVAGISISLTIVFLFLSAKFYDRDLAKKDQLGTFKLASENAP